MSDDINVLSVPGHNGRGCESINGIFHSTVGEAGREDKHVVGAPCVGVNDFLGSADEVLGISLELPFRWLEFFGSCSDGAAGADGGCGDVAACEGEEVGRNGDGLPEGVEGG